MEFTYNPKQKLLQVDSNAKTVKGIARGFQTGIMYLAPSDTSGRINVCPFATDGCRRDCLYTAGRASIGAMGARIRAARIQKTYAFVSNRSEFRARLEREIGAAMRRAWSRNLRPVFRLNGTSDLEFWSIFRGLMADFPECQFYDYSKSTLRVRLYLAGKLPANYHLTFSLSESLASQDAARDFLARGVNVAVVFRTKAFPTSFLGHPVINGDANDLRFTDPKGYVVALSAKGTAKRNLTGFVHDATGI